MINLIRNVWHFVSGIAYKIVNAMLKVTGKSISDAQWAALMQFVKFGLVGVMNTLIDYAAYFIALKIFEHFGLFGDKAYLPSSFIGFAVSVSNAFYWNDKYVFTKNAGEKRSRLQSYIKTVSSYAVTGLGLKTILLWLFITVIGMSNVLAPVIIIFIIVPINFLLNKLWAFRTKKPE